MVMSRISRMIFHAGADVSLLRRLGDAWLFFKGNRNVSYDLHARNMCDYGLASLKEKFSIYQPSKSWGSFIIQLPRCLCLDYEMLSVSTELSNTNKSNRNLL